MQPEVPYAILRCFKATLGALKKNSKSPQIRCVRITGKVWQKNLNSTDTILGYEIQKIRAKALPEALERRKIKAAILSAVVVLRDYTDRRSSREPTVPTHVKLQRSIRKLRKKVYLAESLLRWNRGGGKRLTSTQMNLVSYVA